MTTGASPGNGPTTSSATIVGVLFIVATGAFMAGQTVYGPILAADDYLSLAHPRRVRVIAGILLEVIGVLSIPLIALTIYPVLRRYGESLALMYVGTRMLEAVALLVTDVISWGMVSVSEAYLNAALDGREAWEVTGAALQSVSAAAFLTSVAVLFPISVVMLNSMLWHARLVPRVISGWGLAAGLLLFFGAVPGLLELAPSLPEVVLTGPIAVQEMVLAVWLIGKGFSPGSAQDAVHANV